MTTVEPLALDASAPGNGLYSTADDMVRWLELLVGRGEVDGRHIVDAEALRETWTPQVAIRRSGPELRAYGLGWYVTSWRGRRQLFHGGGGLGFTSQARIFPDEGVAIVVLSNVAAGALPDLVAERASELALGESAGEDLTERAVAMTARIDAIHEAAVEALRATADPGAAPSLEVSDYAGCYEHPAFGRLEMRVEGDAIGASFHGLDLAVEHLHDDVFMLSNSLMGDLAATFSVDDGVVSSVSMLLGSPERERVFTRDAGSCAEGLAGSGQ